MKPYHLYSLLPLSLMTLSCEQPSDPVSKAEPSTTATPQEPSATVPMAPPAFSPVHFVVKGVEQEENQQKVTAALNALAGVTVERISPPERLVTVALESEEIDKALLHQAIRDAGLTIQGEKVTIAVTGLKCPSCCAKLEEAVEEVAGCSAAHACHKAKSLVLIIDTAEASRQQVEQKVVATGYQVGDSSEKP